MSDQRRSPRVPCDIILNKVENGHMHVCRASNISLGGMRIQRLLEPLKDQNEYVRLQFELPGTKDPIWVGAKRVYDQAQDGFIGFTFTYISHQHFVKLRQWIYAAENDAPSEPIVVTMAAS